MGSNSHKYSLKAQINNHLAVCQCTSNNYYSAPLAFMITSIVSRLRACIDCKLNPKQLRAVEQSLSLILEDYNINKREANRENTSNSNIVSRFISAKKVEGCSSRTLSYYETTITAALETIGKNALNIDTDDLRKYLTEYQEHRSSSKNTIDNIRRILSSFYSWLEDEDIVIKSPVRRIHKIKSGTVIKETFSDEQLETLRDGCKNIRDLAMIDLLSSTGMRVGELVNLNREDVDLAQRECIVLGKGNKQRIVYFDARTKLHLEDYLLKRDDSNEALFVSLNEPHTRMTIGGVESRIKLIGLKSRILGAHPHKFRRTMATQAIDKGMPIEQVQRLLGHVRIDTTLQYAMVNQNNVKISHRKFLS